MKSLRRHSVGISFASAPRNYGPSRPAPAARAEPEDAGAKAGAGLAAIAAVKPAGQLPPRIAEGVLVVLDGAPPAGPTLRAAICGTVITLRRELITFNKPITFFERAGGR
jgi:hypothetical protein